MTNEHRKLPPTGSLGELDPARVTRDPLSREIVRVWRELVGEPDGRPTLIACSGGADSVALAAVLWAAASRQRRSVRLGIAHIVHDMRPAEEALRDRDLVREFAGGHGMDFFESSIRIERHENAEASARQKRYEALGRIASREGFPFVATGHHGNDQLETVLMALLRGAGPIGLRGISPTRPLRDGVVLIRPMLGSTRAGVERFVREHALAWAEDRTNEDLTRLRAALRHGPINDLLGLRPGMVHRVGRTAELLGEAGEMIESRAESLYGDGRSWSRSELASEPKLVVGALMRKAAEALAGGNGRDAVGGRVTDPVLDAIRDEMGTSRTFLWPHGIHVHVTRERVEMSRE